MAGLADRAWMTTATTGQGTLTLGSAVGGHMNFNDAGVTNGQTVSYILREGNDFEIGRGVYTTSGTTLTRATVSKSMIAGVVGTTKLTLTGSATVFLDIQVADLLGLNNLSNPGAARITGWSSASSALALLAPAGGIQSGSSNIELTTNNRVATIQVSIDGGGAVITTGAKSHVRIPWSGTIIGSRLLAGNTGSVVLDWHKDTYANYPPTSADSITGSSQPSISTGVKYESTALGGWTVAVTAGDILQPFIRSCSAITSLTAELEIQKASS